MWLFSFGLAIILALGNIAFSRQPRTLKNILGIFALYLLVIDIGLGGLIGAYMHTARADYTAQMIGWAPGSPFQYEVAMMNLGIGVLGVLCLFFRREFWLAAALNVLIVYWGCGFGHLREVTLKANVAPWNAGPGIMFGDFVLPALVLALVVVHARLKG
ncbi:MAG: hypothetical protein MUC35_04565 [Candidatus Margulisbacteria bacterium]|jgi:hypothetical protein|nr:hypothetical protein [Candidatus Margulisiibacteriota bacterium]